MEAPKKGTAAPKGFRTVVTIDLPEAWDYVKVPELVGKVTLLQEIPITDDRGERIAKVAHVDTGKEVVGLWESATLRPLFRNLQEGDTVWVKFEGLGEKKPGRDAPKLFTAAIQE
jgi:hypothetical protein